MKYPTWQELAIVSAGSLATAWVIKKAPVVGSYLVIPAIGALAYTAAVNRPSGGYKLLTGSKS